MSNSICFTGKLENFTRKSAQDLAKENGLDIWTSVKKGLTYLVSAKPDSSSSKFKKATALGVKIISEEDFLKLVDMTAPAKAKRTIWDVFRDADDDLENDKELLRDRVDNSLSECMLSDCEDEIKKMGLTEAQFIDKVVDKLLDGSIDFDESWDDGEEMMQIENVGYDLAQGNAVGTQNAHMESLLGTNANGQINRAFGII